MSASSRANLVVNGGFETGGFNPSADWTAVQPFDQYLFVSSAGGGYGSPHSGSKFAVLAGYTVPFDTIKQTITTEVGVQYEFSFWLRTNGDNSTHADEFRAYFGDDLLLDDKTRAVTDWTEYSYQVTASESLTTLTFSGVIGDTFWGLDDVSLDVVPTSAVPEPSSLALLSLGGITFLVAQTRRRRSKPKT